MKSLCFCLDDALLRSAYLFLMESRLVATDVSCFGRELSALSPSSPSGARAEVKRTMMASPLNFTTSPPCWSMTSIIIEKYLFMWYVTCSAPPSPHSRANRSDSLVKPDTSAIITEALGRGWHTGCLRVKWMVFEPPSAVFLRLLISIRSSWIRRCITIRGRCRQKAALLSITPVLRRSMREVGPGRLLRSLAVLLVVALLSVDSL
mmetsp:Transcript_31631/g.61726  ORF Transcript_31631/g.61726 Transcript_31631/m.61726 type:complete len:206 (+) Transcript_31631:496-1113(+)